VSADFTATERPRPQGWATLRIEHRRSVQDLSSFVRDLRGVERDQFDTSIGFDAFEFWAHFVDDSMYRTCLVPKHASFR
jgi:hypothetical protein